MGPGRGRLNPGRCLVSGQGPPCWVEGGDRATRRRSWKFGREVGERSGRGRAFGGSGTGCLRLLLRARVFVWVGGMGGGVFVSYVYIFFTFSLFVCNVLMSSYACLRLWFSARVSQCVYIKHCNN